MMEFSNILVPLDGSEPSLRAASAAIDLSKKYNSHLYLINVVQSEIGYTFSAGAFGGIVTPSSINSFLENSRKEAEAWFKQILNSQDSLGFQVDSEVILAPKSIVSAIVEYAASHKVELIVIGTSGKSGIKKLLLGSVASGVITYSSCPVLVVR